VPTAVLEDYSNQLIRGLGQWFEQDRWLPLHRALRLQPALPLRLRVAPELRKLEELPWESLPLDRPLWRLPPQDPPQPVAVPRARRARLLLLVGYEQELDLQSEVEELQDLAQRGRQLLRILRASRLFERFEETLNVRYGCVSHAMSATHRTAVMSHARSAAAQRAEAVEVCAHHASD
jgi:hypothetical protein